MNIGVIGGSGFIGSHVVDKLIEQGHEVTVFDIMKPHRNDVRHLYIDITDLSKTAVVLTGDYDAIYLLAAMADVNDVYKNPVEAGEVNILGVANVLEAARRNEINRLILASTIWVYGLSSEKEVTKARHCTLKKLTTYIPHQRLLRNYTARAIRSYTGKTSRYCDMVFRMDRGRGEGR